MSTFRYNTAIAVISLILSGCVSSLTDDLAAVDYRPHALLIPTRELKALQQSEPISSSDLESILIEYSAKASHESAERVNLDTPDPNYAVCAGVIIQNDSMPEGASKYRILGVTERRIPIEGKVVKVLHLRMVK